MGICVLVDDFVGNNTYKQPSSTEVPIGFWLFHHQEDQPSCLNSLPLPSSSIRGLAASDNTYLLGEKCTKNPNSRFQSINRYSSGL